MNVSMMPVLRKRLIAKVFIHLTCIFMLFMLPELLLSLSRGSVSATFKWGVYLKALVYIGVFYINYFYIIGDTLGKPRRQWKFLVYNAILIVAAIFVIHYMWQSLCEFRPKQMHVKPMSDHGRYMRMMSLFLRDLVMLVLTIALSVAVRLSDKWLRLERRAQEITAARKEVELRSLRSQLNPHFLFNTLNTIYALIEVNSEAAQKAVHRLSALLRHVLYENPETTRLSDELDFVRNYVDLMRLRINKMPIELRLEAGGYGMRHVPPLLFVTLIENSFKYGNTGNASHSIEISVCATSEGIECVTKNHFDESVAEKKPKGIGIANLQRRLHLIYGGNASLRTESDNGVFKAYMRLPYIDNH